MKKELLKELEAVKSADEFDNVIDKIDAAGFRFRRYRGNYTDVFSLSLVDRYGRFYGNPEPLKSYHGPVGDDAYIHYLVDDCTSTGKCKLREASKWLYLAEKY